MVNSNNNNKKQILAKRLKKIYQEYQALMQEAKAIQAEEDQLLKQIQQTIDHTKMQRILDKIYKSKD